VESWRERRAHSVDASRRVQLPARSVVRTLGQNVT